MIWVLIILAVMFLVSAVICIPDKLFFWRRKK
jgi:hypothetical protein